MKIEFYKHNLGSDEIEFVSKALKGIFLTAGPLTREFEKKLAEYISCKKVIGTYSCTTALFLCLKALGVREGDEVITTPMTFIATPNSIIEAGAKPIFVDVEKTTGNIDATLIEQAITPRTKAIIPVHLYGHMCDMKKIKVIADKYNLKIVEDAAHCIEGQRDGIRPGQLGDVACFSFYATKNITSGEGGAIATINEKLADRLIMIRSHGMNKEAANRYIGTYQHWEMPFMGYKGNMFDIQAAILLPQISKIENYLKLRKKICLEYEKAFAKLEGIDFLKTLPSTKHARHLFTIWANPKKRDGILYALQKRGIGIAVNYRAIHLLRYYRDTYGYKRGMFPIAERIGDSTITLPLYPRLRNEEIEYVINTVKKVVSVLRS